MSTDTTLLRRSLYAVLITVAVGLALGRVLHAERLYEPSLARDEQDTKSRGSNWPKARPQPMPTFGSNDRSRWATVRALVDDGTFVIGTRERALLEPCAVSLLAATGPLELVLLAEAGYQARIQSERGFLGPDGKRLLPQDGWQTVDRVLKPDTQEFYSTKPPLLATLIAGLYWLLQQLFGWTLADNVWEVVRTILVLVNVLPFLLYLHVLAQLLERYGRSDWGKLYVLALAAFGTLVTPFLITLNNHTLATCCVLFAVQQLLAIQANPRGVSGWRYALLGLLLGFVVTNELPAAALLGVCGLWLLWLAPGRLLLYGLVPALLPIAAMLVLNYVALGEWVPAYAKFDSPAGQEWYQYEGSHWRFPGTRPGIDFAKYRESWAEYALHMLIGHHGWFSLTPVWLLALAAMGWHSCKRQPAAPAPAATLPALLFPLTLVVSVVVIAFYLQHESRNYGGWTCGLRWLMWLTPLWLLCLLPLADRLGQSRGGRWLSYALLAVSVLSASYPAWNPWRHPWLYDLMEAWGWIAY